MYNTTTQQRRLQKDDKYPTEEDESTACDCADESLPVHARRGPTASEFGLALNAAIEAARREGTLSGVLMAEDVFEAGIPGSSTVAPNSEARASSCADQMDFTVVVRL